MVRKSQRTVDKECPVSLPKSPDGLSLTSTWHTHGKFHNTTLLFSHLVFNTFCYDDFCAGLNHNYDSRSPWAQLHSYVRGSTLAMSTPRCDYPIMVTLPYPFYSWQNQGSTIWTQFPTVTDMMVATSKMPPLGTGSGAKSWSAHPPCMWPCVPSITRWN